MTNAAFQVIFLTFTTLKFSNPVMRLFLLICFLLPAFVFPQKMMHSGEWCAAGKHLPASPPPQAADSRSDSIDIVHTEINISLLNTPQVSARCKIKIIPKVNDVPEIRLDLQGLTVDSVFMDGIITSFSKTSGLLTIPFPAQLVSGNTYWLDIVYHGQPVTDASNWGGFTTKAGTLSTLESASTPIRIRLAEPGFLVSTISWSAAPSRLRSHHRRQNRVIQMVYWSVKRSNQAR